MTTAMKPRVRKTLKELANGSGPIPGLARDVTVEVKCQRCARPFWVFRDDLPQEPLCAGCLGSEASGSKQAAKQEQPEKQAKVPAPREGARRLPLNRIASSRFQTRQDFPAAEIAELAASLEAQGLIQPVVVRRLPPALFLTSLAAADEGADWELVAGERRCRAALAAGWSEIDAVERACESDAAAIELTIAENLQRKDVSQVELAGGVRMWMQAAGADERAAAEKFGYSLSALRNLLRLLDAPEDWRRRVVSREISGTHLRHALPYLHAPAIAAALAKLIDARVKEDGGFAESERQWERTVKDAVRQHAARLSRSVSVREPSWQSGEVRIDKRHPQYAELDVVQLKPSWGGAPVSYALNAKLANSILAEQAKAWQAKRQPAAGTKAKGNGKAGPTAAELKAQAAEAKRKSDAELGSLVADWRCWLCSHAIACRDDLATIAGLSIAMNFSGMFEDGFEGARQAIKEIWPRASRWDRSLGLKWLRSSADERARAIGRLVQTAFWQDGLGRTATWIQADDPELLAWCELLEVDLAAAWRAKQEDGGQAFCGPLTEKFFELLSAVELTELAAEWKVGRAEDGAEALRAKFRQSPQRVFPLPRLLAAFAGKPKKRKAK